MLSGYPNRAASPLVQQVENPRELINLWRPVPTFRGSRERLDKYYGLGFHIQ